MAGGNRGVASWDQRSYYVSSGGTHTFKWVYAKSGGGGQDYGAVDRVVWSPSWPAGRDLADGVDSFLTYTTGGDSDWIVGGDGCFDVDDAKSGDLEYQQSNWLETTVQGPGTFKFWWKTYTNNGGGGNELQFWIGTSLQATINGNRDSAQRTYTLGGQPHAQMDLQPEHGEPLPRLGLGGPRGVVRPAGRGPGPQRLAGAPPTCTMPPAGGSRRSTTT